MCWAKMPLCGQNTVLRNNMHKNSIFSVFFKFWVSRNPDFQPWHSQGQVFQQHSMPWRFLQYSTNNEHKVFFRWLIPHIFWKYAQIIFAVIISSFFNSLNTIFLLLPYWENIWGAIMRTKSNQNSKNHPNLKSPWD